MAHRYDALKEHLQRVEAAKVALSFAEIESILGARLPESARKHLAWWSNSTKSWQSRTWLSVGFRARASLRDERVEFYRADSATEPASVLRLRLRWNVEDHLATVDTTFDRCLLEFESRRIFSGPSVYFYEELLKLIRSVPSLQELASSDRLIELSYATFTSWGVHRMGECGHKAHRVPSLPGCGARLD